ncbi:hypothetical protein BaRGS_00037374, partial [Batillaria attramentaria]
TSGGRDNCRQGDGLKPVTDDVDSNSRWRFQLIKDCPTPSRHLASTLPRPAATIDSDGYGRRSDKELS